MSVFKVGDVVAGLSNNGYGITNGRMTRGLVEKVSDDGRSMEVRVISHIDHYEIGSSYDVEASEDRFRKITDLLEFDREKVFELIKAGKVPEVNKYNTIGADLSGLKVEKETDLSGIILTGANLVRANLVRANLVRANLVRANLVRANLDGANLVRANLDGANLVRANLDGANLDGANLVRANLDGANLDGANLVRANLDGVKYNENTAFFAMQCPEEGSFIGYKLAVANFNNCIVKLRITEDALRSSATSRKCRCSKAEVLSITDMEGNELDVVAHSSYDRSFKYKVGETVQVDNFNTNRWKECAAGIHFFITKQEAINYSRY